MGREMALGLSLLPKESMITSRLRRTSMFVPSLLVASRIRTVWLRRLDKT